MTVVDAAVVLALRHPDCMRIKDAERRVGGKPGEVGTGDNEAVVTFEHTVLTQAV